MVNAGAMARFQFQRLGYFRVDPDSTRARLVVNRTATLKDTWAKTAGVSACQVVSESVVRGQSGAETDGTAEEQLPRFPVHGRNIAPVGAPDHSSFGRWSRGDREQKISPTMRAFVK